MPCSISAWHFASILALQHGVLKKLVLLLVAVLGCQLLQAQFSSISTDVSILRSVTKGSRFFAFGQTVQSQYHFTEKTTGYAWVSYYSAGHFKNSLTATGKDSIAVPQQLAFDVNSTLRYRQFSLGIRHYFKGTYNNETTWNLYSITGFGLLLLKATNSYNVTIDSARYNIPQQVLAGTKNLVRLTADLGLGVETILGSGVYLYGDVRTWIQASTFSSPYLYNNNVPRVVIVSGGIRILFD